MPSVSPPNLLERGLDVCVDAMVTLDSGDAPVDRFARVDGTSGHEHLCARARRAHGRFPAPRRTFPPVTSAVWRSS